MDETRTALRVIGPPAVIGGTVTSPAVQTIRGPRQIAALALLVSRRGRVVRRELLEEELWDGDPVSESAVRVTVGRVRRAFVEAWGVDPITARNGGYSLEVDPAVIDGERFIAQVAAALRALDAGDVARVDAIASAALDTWSGEPYQGAAALSVIDTERARLDSARHDLEEAHARALLTLGRPDDAHSAAMAVVGDDPFREQAWLLAMAALHAGGRSAEALRVHTRLASLLDAELRVAPGADVEAVRAAIAGRASVGEVMGLTRPAHARPNPVVSRPSVLPERGPLIGRTTERSQLDDLVGDTATRVIVIEGPAGIGKTRLGEHAAAVARAAGLRLAVARCPREGGTGQLVVRQLATQLAEGGAAAEGPVAAALGLATDPTETDVGAPLPEQDPGAERLRLYVAMEDLLLAAGPALVVLDDAQWVDASVASLIAHLAELAPSVRWLVLARTGERSPAAVELLGDLARLGAIWHDLGPLDPSTAAALVAQRAPGLDRAQVEAVVARGGGHPLLLGELAVHVDRGGDANAVPASIDAVVAAELTRLGEDAAAVARVVGIAETAHPLRAVVAAAGLDGAAATRAVTALVSASLAVTDVGRREIEPSHELVRQALVRPLAHHEVQAVHRRLARVLAEDLDPDAKLLLRHLAADELVDIDELEQVGSAAFDDPSLFGAPQALADLGALLVSRAGEAGRDRTNVQTRLRIASARFAVGDLSGGQRLLDAQRPVLDALDDPVLLARALITRTNLAVAGAVPEDELARAEAVLARVPTEELALRVMLGCWIGYLSYGARGLAAAQRLADGAAEDLAGAPPGASGLAQLEGQIVTLRLACSMDLASPPGETDRLTDQLVAIAETTHDPTNLVSARLAQVERAMRTGTVDDAARAVAMADQLDTPVQRVESRWFIAASRAALDLMRGDLAAAHRSSLAALSAGMAHGVGSSVPTAMLQRSVLDWETGRFGDLRPMVPALAPGQPTALTLANLLLCIDADDERGARAAADLLVAGPHLLAEPNPGQWAAVAALAGMAASRLRHAELGSAISHALAGRPDEGLTAVGLCYLGPVSLARGLALAGAGEVEAALEDLDRAVERELFVGAPISLSRAALAAAELRTARARRGDRTEATRLRALAAEARGRMRFPPRT